VQLAAELGEGLDGLQRGAQELLEAMQDDVAARMGSSCATQ
jgi:hypothetical protein